MHRKDAFITRTTVMVLILCIISTMMPVSTFAATVTYSLPEVYGPESGITIMYSDVTVNGQGITLQNLDIRGKLTITSNVGNGSVILNNVKVSGTTAIRGGGEEGIFINNSTLSRAVTVSKPGSKVGLIASGTSSIAQVNATSSVLLEERDLASASIGFNNVTITAPSGSTVTLEGTFNSVRVDRAGVKILIPFGSSVNTLVVNRQAAFTGAGVVNRAYIYASGVTFEYAPLVLGGTYKPTIVPPNKTLLNEAIADAATNSSRTKVSTDGADVLTTETWVTQGVMTAYSDAISSAKAVYQSTTITQADLDSALASLKSATAAFDAAKAPGTKADKTALLNAIKDAEANLAAAEPGTLPGQYPAETMAAYGVAIDAAKAVANDGSATQTQVDLALDDLSKATVAFKASVSLPVPAAPAVIGDDILNTVSGIKSGMEYKLDSGEYVEYGGTLPSLEGNHTLRVRVAAVDGSSKAGLDTVLEFTANLPGKLIITFEGAYTDQMAGAKPILDGAGFKATMYVSGSVIGVTGYMTLDELKAMYGAGWDMGNMTFDYNANGSTTDPALFEALVKSYGDNQKWLVDNGLARGVDHVAYPYGRYTPELIEALKTMGILTGRTTDYGTVPDTISGNGFYELPIRWLGSSIDANTIIRDINNSVENGGTVVVIANSNDPAYADLATVVDYAYGLSKAGKLKVMTVSEWYAQNPFPVVPSVPLVSADDTANTVTGMAAGMEYSVDYAPYVPYDAYDLSKLILDGDRALMVRYAASGINPAGPARTLIFTANQEVRAAKIIFTFDDGWRDNLTYALPIFEAAGIKGTLYASETLSNQYDGNPIMQVKELQKLYDAGWDIGNHTTTHANIGDLTDQASLATLRTIYQDNQEWLIENGLIRGAYHAAYPSGLYSDALMEILKGIGVLSSRAALESGTIPESTLFQAGFRELFTMPVMYLETAAGEDMAGDLIEAMNSAASTGDDIFVLLHRVNPVVDVTDPYNMAVTVADLQRVVDAAKTLKEDGKISVMTVSEWYSSVVK